MLLFPREMASKGSLGYKRRRNDPSLDCSESVSDEDFVRDCYPTTSSGSSSTSSSSSSYSSGSDGTSDDSSSGVDSRSEYYYSRTNKRSQYDTYSDYESSYESSSRSKTRKGFPSDVRGRRTGAGQCFPKCGMTILGEGSFAVVYRTYCEDNKTPFAVKCAKSSRRGALKSLTKEADVLKQLNSPYVIEYLGERRVPVPLKPRSRATGPKMVPRVTEMYLPYMVGGTLSDEIRDCLKKKQVMEENVIKSYTKQILRGLSYIHSKNIVHCDIKGSNILLGKPNLKISDFGVCKHIGMIPNKSRGSISRAGTKAWMAPEVHKRIEQRFPADVWSLGCTVVQMITGKPPMTAELKAFLSPDTLEEGMVSNVIPKDFQRLSSECIDFLRKCFLIDTKARWTCEQLLYHRFLGTKPAERPREPHSRTTKQNQEPTNQKEAKRNRTVRPD
ncbi:unnamed protein product [Calypogeia fissa]